MFAPFEFIIFARYCDTPVEFKSNRTRLSACEILLNLNATAPT
ncbi:hypothetical protein CAMGR0001_1235 [Campylobacter gracilis RM3268]|uniref:Uncharacterized protein n=1 Tax=Campylobacter gracilis RM3268 TaxID=553220 RepID=C8PJ36_9BACT|nr:hypothetical protein CAMGR0001_1235 [Campylobacter gracilis RM3268]